MTETAITDGPSRFGSDSSQFNKPIHRAAADVFSGAEDVFSGASAQPTAGRPKAGRPEAARGRLRWAGDRRNGGGIDGQQRLTGQSPTAPAEPIDKGNAPTVCDRVERIWRHKSPMHTGPRRGRGGVQNAAKPLRRSRLRRSRWDAERPMGGMEPSALRGGRWRARHGPSPGARPGPGSEPATPETLNSAHRPAWPVGPG